MQQERPARISVKELSLLTETDAVEKQEKELIALKQQIEEEHERYEKELKLKEDECMALQLKCESAKCEKEEAMKNLDKLLKSGLMAADLPHEERQDASQPTSLPLKTEQTVQTQHLSPTVAEGEEEHEEMPYKKLRHAMNEAQLSITLWDQYRDKHTTFDESEGILVSTLDEMRSLWQEFVRTKAADTADDVMFHLLLEDLSWQFRENSMLTKSVLALTSEEMQVWKKLNDIEETDELKMKVVTPLPSKFISITSDEALLQQLCYMGTGINQLVVGLEGGSFILGSGDASLEFPPGAVEKKIVVHYAVILHGPFVFPAGYKPGSVVVYINMDGTTLMKPIKLLLSHWCIKEEGDDKNTLKFISAPHSLEAGQQKYAFEEEEEEADFTHTNVGVLTIQNPHCLFCVETKKEKIARYSAISFSRYNRLEETMLFRIQFMCDSLDWNEKLTRTLQQKEWKKTCDADDVIQFQYAADHKQITASPQEMAGPGWEAAIHGKQAVIEQLFLAPLEKSKEYVETEVSTGRFPPCILYHILYTSPEQNRVKSALMKVQVNGADVPLIFSCRIKEDPSITLPMSPGTSNPVSGPVTPPSSTVSITPRDILKALKHQFDAVWCEFGAFLGVDYSTTSAINIDKAGNTSACMVALVGKWLSKETGTGDLPRTWQTVVEAVKDTGFPQLAQELADEHNVTLPKT